MRTEISDNVVRIRGTEFQARINGRFLFLPPTARVGRAIQLYDFLDAQLPPEIDTFILFEDDPDSELILFGRRFFFSVASYLEAGPAVAKNRRDWRVRSYPVPLLTEEREREWAEHEEHKSLTEAPARARVQGNADGARRDETPSGLTFISSKDNTDGTTL